jgi:hypothetical protein
MGAFVKVNLVALRGSAETLMPPRLVFKNDK